MSAAAITLFATAATGSAMTSPSGSSSPSSTIQNPYSPTTGHPYRHGAVPNRNQLAKEKAWDAAHPAAATTAAATGPETLSYGGGIDGTGVMSGGKSQVYLVFYGNQWGTQGTDANGNATFSGDSSGVASVTQQMFKGIGTNNELWSADLTQWCDGAGVNSGDVACSSSIPASQFVPYQSGGVLAGVWYDNSAASPSAASGHQLGQEALNAAHHFGNTTAAANRHAYYVIMSPTGTNPDNYQGQYCAWHDYNGDSTLTGGAVSSDVGDFAFSNQPYNIDSGAGCGVGFVNSPGTTDGYTMTLGHEWHETLSDQNPAGGWTNHVSGSSYNGQENSDECAWLSPGTSGGAANISFGSFGSYAEQASWSNDTNSCAISHPIVQHPGGTETITVSNPGNQTSTQNTAISTLQISATDSAGKSLTYSATGLPAGLSISSSGAITGTPTGTGTSSVTVTANSGTASNTTTFSWTVNAQGGTETVSVTSPGNQTSTQGTAIGTLQMKATDSAGKSLTYSATGLPAGLSISSSGAITGTPTGTGSATVTVTASSGTASGSTSFTWTVNPSGGSGCTAAQLLGNPGFETGSAAPWSASAGVINSDTVSEPAHSGSYNAWLDGYGTTHTDTLAQSVSIPAGCTTASFSFYLHIDTDETTATTAYDKLKVQVLNSSGTVLGTLATYSNLNANSGYTQHSFNLASYAGQTVTLKFTGTEDVSLQTSFVLDDTALNVH